MVGDAEGPARPVELADPVLAELVREQMAQVGRDDLAQLAQRAGHQGDPAPSAAYLAIVAPVKIDSSSGCACTSSRLLFTTTIMPRPDLA